MFRRSWFRIPAPHTGWTFFSRIFVVKTDVFEKRKKTEKEVIDGPFKKGKV